MNEHQVPSKIGVQDIQNESILWPCIGPPEWTHFTYGWVGETEEFKRLKKFILEILKAQHIFKSPPQDLGLCLFWYAALDMPDKVKHDPPIYKNCILLSEIWFQVRKIAPIFTQSPVLKHTIHVFSICLAILKLFHNIVFYSLHNNISL